MWRLTKPHGSQRAPSPCEPESPLRRTSPGRFLVPFTLPPSSVLLMCACVAHTLSWRHSALCSVLYSLSVLRLVAGEQPVAKGFDERLLLVEAECADDAG
jgi:hypothetical protein